MISFISGNQNKFQEISAVLRTDLELVNLDLVEIQEMDAQKVIEHKLVEAGKHVTGAILIEDTSLYLSCLPGLPGPFIKWFLQSLGCEGLYQLTKHYDNFEAEAKTILGYQDENGVLSYFEGTCKGIITEPKVTTSFGWDPVFIPEGHSVSFGELDREIKQTISMRGKAVEKLNNYLQI